MTPDEMTTVIRDLGIASSRLKDQEKDIDNLAAAQRELGEQIGKRIDGFRDACHVEVEGVHKEIAKLRKERDQGEEKLRAEIKAKDAKREWSRIEVFMAIGLTLTFITVVLGIVLPT
jgi:hypothetical protein